MTASAPIRFLLLVISEDSAKPGDGAHNRYQVLQKFCFFQASRPDINGGHLEQPERLKRELVFGLAKEQLLRTGVRLPPRWSILRAWSGARAGDWSSEDGEIRKDTWLIRHRRGGRVTVSPVTALRQRIYA